MRNNVDMERVTKVMEALPKIRPSMPIILGTGKTMVVSRLSIMYYYYVNNLFSKKDNDRGNEYVVPCPFHRENTPSMSINLSKDVCHCLSCQRGGNIFAFQSQYEREVVGRSGNFYSIIDNTLKGDAELKAIVGFTTIYEEKAQVDLENMVFKKLPIRKTYAPTSYLDIQERMVRKGKTSKEDILLFITLMNNEAPLSEIYRVIFTDEEDVIVDNKEDEYLRQAIHSINSFSLDLGGQ